MDLENTDNKTNNLLRVALLKVIIPAVLVALIVNVLFGEKKQSNKTLADKSITAGNYKAAAEKLQLQISEDFSNIELHRNYLNAQHKNIRRDTNSAIKFDTLNKYQHYADSNDTETSDIGYYGLGFFHGLLKEYNAALENYQKVKNKNMPFLNNSVGHLYFKLQDQQKAILYFEKEIEIVDGNIEGAYYNIAELYYGNKNFQQLNKLIQNQDAKKYIPPHIYRVLLLKNGNILGYLANSVKCNYVTCIGLLAAFAITLIWFLYLRKIDVFEPEPVKYLLITLLMGMLFAELCSLGYDFFDYGTNIKLHRNILQDAVYCVFAIGFIEELVKIIPFLIILRYSKQVNESIDYFIYASVAALGFAFMENLLYFQDSGIHRIAGRALTSVFMHMSLTSIAAYGLFYAKYFLNNHKRLLCFTASFFTAMLLHASYDFWIISENIDKQLRAFTFFTLLFSLILYAGILRKAIDLSEFKSQSRQKIAKLSEYLFCSLSWVFILQYLLMGIKFGSSNANHSLKAEILPLSYLMFYIVAGLGTVSKVKKNKSKQNTSKFFLSAFAGQNKNR